MGEYGQAGLFPQEVAPSRRPASHAPRPGADTCGIIHSDSATVDHANTAPGTVAAGPTVGISGKGGAW